ncbi:hypothetical protein GH714_019695 [Hevea brasiliensis]|uniref:Cation-transporting P-type ATPase N-terminal domain-containing protein n=1 Tax=Hevea brasiliensis TaxID=3981 RepID=A0A6A6NCZ5_HEVBR|nr:hypothetical protein GH714_019695 [Hevea brasiliensis]
MVADLAKRAEAERKRKKLQEKIRVALYVQKAALHFIDAVNRVEYKLSNDVKEAGFCVGPDELASIVRSHDSKALGSHGGVEGLARHISVSLNDGIVSTDVSTRQNIYGLNQHAEKPSRSFWMFVWEALHDLTLIILMMCAVISIGVGIATEGWPKGMYDGLGIILCIFLVVIVTAVSDYKQSLQFKVLDKEKKNVLVQVTREGCRQKVSIYDLVVGDIVHLSIGDVVPADGVLISGHSLSVDESSLSVTAVGMRTEWGRLMATLSETGEDETPLQVKLNGVATIIGKIGLAFAVMTFLVLMGRFLVVKAQHQELTKWSTTDALQVLNFFAIAVTIIVVAVPEGLPLAVTLSLAFAMKKLMRDKALVRHLSACETMGSATCICTDKTGTLTTNHMVVNKIWICEETKLITRKEDVLSSISKEVQRILLQSIFQNTASEVAKGKDGKTNILGTPTETAIVEFGLHMGGDFNVHRKESEIVKVEPFNSVKKKMSVLVSLPNKMGFEHFAKDIEKPDCIPEDNYTLVAVVGIKDPVRPGVKEAVKTCLEAGIIVRIVTGDNINTAKAIARECGILTDDGIAIEGPDFRDKSPQEMEEIIPKLQVMARSSPSDKHKLVTQLRNVFKEVVAVTGDGTNDAPALAQADIGLAMGIAGTEVAKESADVIIMDDNFTTIVNVGRWGRSVYINIQKFVQFQLTVNVVALMINFISACVSGDAPLTTVQLLWVNLIMDTLGALALATEPPNDALMKRPPIGRNFNGKRLLKLTGSDATDILNTFIFNTFVFCQVFNEINSRDMVKINVFERVLDSWVFLGVMFSTVSFQIVMVELLGAFADTVPLSWDLWLASVLIGAASLVVAVVLKCIPVQTGQDHQVAKGHDGYEPLPSGPDMA